mmetsp:Transcript_9200/g.21832  ORF Transcript_9200/g.21832 Transcript_9200/m.21832 type:complete len:316 (+) Transcript_9200:40-987(+)
MADGWHPSASSSVGAGNASATLHQVSCFGRLQGAANSNVREAVQILQCLNPPLRLNLRWRALLWRSRRHWAVVLLPDLGPGGFPARVDGELLRGGASDASSAIINVPSNCLYLVFELLVANRDCDFFLRLSAFPSFDARRGNVLDLGPYGPVRLEQLAERAIGVIGRYRAYGLIGCNCQHYALELCRELGVKTPATRTDDRRAEEAAARGFQAYSLGVGIAKGVSAALGAAATGIGCAGAAGALLLSAHVAAGCAVGFLGGVALEGGYEWLCRQHRQEGLQEASQQESDGVGDESSLAIQPPQSEGLLVSWGELT